MRKRLFLLAAPLAIVAALGLSRLPAGAQQDPLKTVLADEAKRVAAVEKVRPSVVAVFGLSAKGGGSGVIISKDGYALTNYHVVKPSGALMKCGLADGVFYDAVLVGWDMVGDVALIKLLPKKEGQEFPVSPMGDSDKLQEGDWSLAMGNPFLLATDFTPTVTFGMISGVHRYQYPSGTILEYTDCIQIDTSINPGNSGGPLFNLQGELIGINGRGSFDKRGRVNSGVGYAISINQIKNFMGHLKGGLNADHATLGATVTTQTERDGLARMVFTNILEEADVARRGVGYGDEMVSFDGREITSTNHYLNVLGLYPRGWRLPMVFRNNKGLNETLVRLMGKTPKQVAPEPKDKASLQQPEQPKIQPPKLQPKPKVDPKSPAAKYYDAKPGYVNFYFNKLEKDRVFAGFKKHAALGKKGDDCLITGQIQLKQLTTAAPFKVEIKDAAGQKPGVRLTVNQFPYKVEPLNEESTLPELQQPGGSGGLMVAMYLYHRMLTLGEGGFTAKCDYAGQFPYYPPQADGKNPPSWRLTKTIADVVETRFSIYETKWFFAPEDGKLMAFEVWLDQFTDPCEVYLSYAKDNKNGLPQQMQVRFGDGTYGTISVENIDLGAAK